MDCEECGGTMELEDREPPKHGLCWPCASSELEILSERFAALEKVLVEARAVADTLDDLDNAALAGIVYGLKTKIIEYEAKYPTPEGPTPEDALGEEEAEAEQERRHEQPVLGCDCHDCMR